MSELPPPEAFESVLDSELPPVVRERRRQTRRTFYAMVLEELDAGRFNRRRRAELLRFARELGLDGMDVQLLITGAEYRAGYCPRSSLLGRVDAAETGFLAKVDEPRGAGAASLIVAGAAWGAMAALLMYWAK